MTFFDGLAEIDLHDYIASNEWEVLSNVAKRNEKFYPCCKEPYPDLTFHLKLKRKVNIEIYNTFNK